MVLLLHREDEKHNTFLTRTQGEKNRPSFGSVMGAFCSKREGYIGRSVNASSGNLYPSLAILIDPAYCLIAEHHRNVI